MDSFRSAALFDYLAPRASLDLFVRHRPSARLPSSEVSALHAALLRQVKEADARADTRQAPERLVARARLEVYEAGLSLAERMKSEQPTAMQMLAYLGIPCDFEGERFLRYLKAASHFERVHPAQVFWRGRTSGIYLGCLWAQKHHGTSLVRHAEEQLERYGSERALAFPVWFERLEMPSVRARLSLVSITTLLRVAGLALRMPDGVVPVRKRRIDTPMWSHALAQNPAVDYPCVAMHILEELRKQPREMSYLYYRVAVPGQKNYGNPAAPFSRGAVEHAANLLLSLGLIERIRETRKVTLRPRGFRSESQQFKVTEKGLPLIAQSQIAGRLNEKLRRLLVGEEE